MLEKTITALKAAEDVIQQEYENVKGWNAQSRGALEEVYGAITSARARLELIEPPAEVAIEAPPTAPTDGGESAPSTEGEAGAAAEPFPEAVEVTTAPGEEVTRG